ncbi:MAG: aminotransferase class I/II-fold pyridoxal phosphate-dependent enzyme [Clostridia bacterium]|nr:aminotransferase class I/II-fold pyridoxal phosphate-dependent enzyme [Clostridia bacterium]
MREMREPLILSAIEKYALKGAARFHMPGHKGRGEFGKLFPVAATDVTELSFSGSLEAGEGVVREAEEQIAEVLNAARSHLVTDGSSAAILSMIFAASKRGDKIVIPRISHKSVYNALKLFGLEPLFLREEERDGMIIQDVASIEKIVSENDGVAAILLVSPDYYGNVPDLKKAREIANKAGVPLMIDGAHGGHLKFSAPELYAGGYADVWVDGLHKTLPCLTQAAVLNVNDESLSGDVAEGLSIFRTTSPSYPIMASAEYGIYYGEHVGREGYEKLFALADGFKNGAARTGYRFASADDKTKIILDCPSSEVDCGKLAGFLEERGVFPEFSNGRYIVFMASINSAPEDFDKLLAALISFRGKFGRENADNMRNRALIGYKPKRRTDYLSAARAPGEWVDLKESAGRISASDAGFFPPCYPVITAGEEIDRNIISALAGREDVFGLDGGKIKTVKEK